MSVMIKCMQMPENCDKCTFSLWSNLHQTAMCEQKDCEPCFEDFSKDYKIKRAGLCPLVEIPTLHGRLIDINDVVSAKRPTDREPEKNEAMALYKAGWDAAIEAIIENAPTIIEAEGNNDEWAV